MTTMNHVSSLSESSILIVGLARNCSQSLPTSISVLSSAFTKCNSLSFLIIESDSSDSTIETLSRLAVIYRPFRFISLGHLADQLPRRTERIAFCRNYYLSIIDNTSAFDNIDYVVVADLDGVNTCLESDSVSSCWSRLDWDVCTANQDGPYYDIWAFRHSLLSPNDCSQQQKFLERLGVSRFSSLYSSTFSRMIKIPSGHQWIEVDSAFGGLAIYRRSILRDVRYVGLSLCGDEVCEHVSFHSDIKTNGGRIFINPALINSKTNPHSRKATFIGLIKLWFSCQLLDFFSTISLTNVKSHLRLFLFLFMFACYST